MVQRVLEATINELAVSGYRAFRMDAVSFDAVVNKTTIYRRWPTRASLVVAAMLWMRRFVHDIPLPDTGSVVDDLVQALLRKVSFKDRVEGQAWAKLLAEKHDPDVQVIISDSVRERSAEWDEMITRAIKRRELPKGTDPRLVFGMLGPIADAWNMRAGGRLKAEQLEVAVRTVIAGARTGTLVPSR
ncbi:MAG: TetR/AcrR family transcriptional regulator C-terminal ligand-binding domain-containing protein [Archangium sp.]|nr:TetR/AcrR family transcriptional regulator C-terminal ligand-binding domain-containing protein [Archangium sp.]